MTEAMPERPAVLFVGRRDHPEFVPAVQWLQAHALPCFVSSVPAAAREMERGDSVPAIIVLAQSRRGEVSQRDHDALVRLAPLAHVIVLLGSWCEGETRSGVPVNGCSRVYWHQFRDRAAIEFFAPRLPRGARWFPKTITENERGLARSGWRLQAGTGVVAINTPCRVDYDALGAACRTAGFNTVWCQRAAEETVASAGCVVWDRWGFEGSDLEEWMRWRERWDHVPTLATIGFPRRQDFDAVGEGCLRGVLAKPFVLAELWHAVQAVMESNGCQAEAA